MMVPSVALKVRHVAKLGFAILTSAAALSSAVISFDVSAQEQVQEKAMDLETAIRHFELNQWVPALLGFQVLADAGDPVAQTYAGVMYREGYGIEKNSKEAKRWLTLGAQNGNAWAQHQLGWMYARAEITDDRDFASAVRYWKAAAEGGNAAAQLDLAVMYWRGEGTPKDLVKAYTWLALSARDDEFTQMAEANMTGLKKNMSREQIEEAEELAKGLMAEIEPKS